MGWEVGNNSPKIPQNTFLTKNCTKFLYFLPSSTLLGRLTNAEAIQGSQKSAPNTNSCCAYMWIPLMLPIASPMEWIHHYQWLSIISGHPGVMLWLRPDL